MSGNVPAPSSGLGSNSNYIFANNCSAILGLSVTIDVTESLICAANSAPPAGDGPQEYGLSFQLNAYSPAKETSAYQQYVISLFNAQLNAVINNYPLSGSYFINAYKDLSTVPKLSIPAGYQLQISLLNDTQNNITGANYTARTRGEAPAAGSALTGYWGSDSSQHVNFIGADGHVHEIYIHPGANWVNNDLNAFAGGALPAAGSALTGYWGSDSSQHVNFIGTDGHVHELYIHPGASWANNDLNAFAGGVAPRAGSPLTAYWGNDNSQHVFFIGTDGHVHELYIHPGASWSNNDLTVNAGGVLPAQNSPLHAYWGSDNSQHINFLGSDGHVHELYIHPGAPGWSNNNLTATTGGVLPAAGSALTGYWGSDSSQHVNFLGADGHVHELFIHPGAGWVNNDLTAFAGGGVLPAAGSRLTGYWGSDSSQHVNFVGTDGHVHELYIHPGAGWVNNDLTAFSSGGVSPAQGAMLHAYWGSDSSQHVNFLGSDGHVRELYIHPGAAWVNNDLTDILQGSVQQLILSSSGVTSADLAPIVAFELDLVGPADAESVTLSSGAGTITYTATTALSALSAKPACAIAGVITAETANSVYGPLPDGASTSFTQTFSITTASKMIRRVGPKQLALPGPRVLAAVG